MSANNIDFMAKKMQLRAGRMVDHDFISYVIDLLAARITDEQLDSIAKPEAGGSNYTRVKYKAIYAAGFPIEYQRRYNRLAQYLLKSVPSSQAFDELARLTFLAMPEIKEAYDSIPQSYIDYGKNGEEIDRYLAVLGWPSRSAFFYDMMCGAPTGEYFISTLTHLEHLRAYIGETYASAYYTNLMDMCMGGKDIILTEKQSERVDACRLEFPPGNELAKDYIAKVFRKYGINANTANMYPARLLTVFKAYENGQFRLPTLDTPPLKDKKDICKFTAFMYVCVDGIMEQAERARGLFLSIREKLSMKELEQAVTFAQGLDIKVSEAIELLSVCKTLNMLVEDREKLYEQCAVLEKSNDTLTAAADKYRSAAEIADKKRRQTVADCENRVKRLETERDNIYKRAQKEKSEKAMKQKKEAEHLRTVNKTLKSETERLKSEIAKLRKELHENKESLARAAYYEANAEEMQRTIAELSAYIPEQAEDDIRTSDMHYPLNGKNIVIVGGHENWRHRMQAIFSGVKVISPDMLGYDTEVLRNADSVWIQTAYISHKMTYKTCGAAQRMMLPMHFFYTTGVYTCATMLANYLDGTKENVKEISET